GGVDIQEQRDESPDVLDRDSMRMEIEEDGGLLLEKSGLEVDVVFAMVEGVGVIFLGGRGRGTLSSSALLRGTETSGGGVEIGLSGGGLPLSFLGAGQGGRAGCSVGGQRRGALGAAPVRGGVQRRRQWKEKT